ncbi:M56 family metallopeptidase [Hymenobacter jejuensis]|uniref:M56 family metallopeptidase n=1 Tax=Hymenobacter jejuensis TaxID=2502781 RepID=A0A5B8A149_9BACT|nr:M56 family metallopeptidase [Hymenobacter jejuensis]QDA59862.1 M56 family metallopeptidase [Hymenobacter jejuensis]
MTTLLLLNWMLLSTLCLGAGWLLYRFALRSERSFGYNRWYLLLAPALAAALPWLPLPAVWGTALRGVALPPMTVLLPVVRVGTAATPETSFYVSNWLLIMYTTIAALMMIRLGVRLWHLHRLARGLPGERQAGYTMVRTGGKLPISSFGRTVYWDETAPLTTAEAEQVLRHELAHVQQGHTYDRLVLDVLRAVLWFNPFVHLFPRALALTHEYLADEAVLHETPTASPAQYATLLAQQASQRLGLSLTAAHSFTQSHTLNRIAMLYKNPPARRWKQWLVLPVSGLLLFAVACQKEAIPTLTAAASASQANLPPPPPPPPLAPPPPPPPPSYAVGRKIYTSVEKMPEYQGGYAQLLQDIGSAVQYPAIAQEAKLEGKVFIRFVVGTDGQVHDVEIQKGVVAPAGQEAAAEALNNEALRVIENLPGTWKPGIQRGKKVDVSFTVPISYASK